MNNLNILIDTMTNAAKTPNNTTNFAASPQKTISNSALGNIIAYARSKLTRPDVVAAAASDSCNIAADIAHLQHALERAESIETRDDPRCIKQGILGHSLFLLSEQIGLKMTTVLTLRCIKTVHLILEERDMTQFQKIVNDSIKPFQSLILEIKPLIEAFKEKDINNIYSTELGDCMQSLSESIVIFFTAVQSITSRGGIPTPTRSDRRAGDNIIKVLDRIIVTCSAVYSVNMHAIKSVDPVAGAAYALTLRTPMEEKLVKMIIDLRLRMDLMYQSILSWAAGSSDIDSNQNGSIDKYGDNVRSIIDDINSALDIARKLTVFDESPVKKLLTEFACKDIGDYALKMLTELRVIAKETPANKEARIAAVSHKFRLFYVMTRQSVDILYIAVTTDGAAASTGIGCYAKLVNTVVTDLAKLTEAQPISTGDVKEALINSEMYFSKYILILDALTSSVTSSYQLDGVPIPALRAVIGLLKGHRSTLAAAAKRALTSQESAPAGSLTLTLVEEILSCNDVITPTNVRVLSYQAAFQRDSEYLFAYLKDSGPTGIRTLHPQLLTEYVRTLLLILQGLQGGIKRLSAKSPLYSAAEDKCRGFAPHMQTLVALARNPSATPGDIAAAQGSVRAIIADIAQVAACVSTPATLSDLKLPLPVEETLSKWADDVTANNGGMTFARVPVEHGPLSPTLAELAHTIEGAISGINVAERCGQAGRQAVGIAKELAKSLAVMALENGGAELVMGAAEGVVVTCRSIIKINGRAAEGFRRMFKFGYTGLMMMNIGCIVNLMDFRVCVAAYAYNKKEYKNVFENIVKELVLNIIDVVCALVSYEI